MTYMTAPQEMIVPLDTGLAQSGVQQYRLRRMGGRPLEFNGIELGMAMSFSPELPYWYEINLYQTTQQGFVLAIRLFFQSESERDVVSAWTFETLAEAIDALEGYDAAEDVRLTLDAETGNMCAAELAACAMTLRARAIAARSHFSSLVGEFLHQLEVPA